MARKLNQGVGLITHKSRDAYKRSGDLMNLKFVEGGSASYAHTKLVDVDSVAHY